MRTKLATGSLIVALSLIASSASALQPGTVGGALQQPGKAYGEVPRPLKMTQRVGNFVLRNIQRASVAARGQVFVDTHERPLDPHRNWLVSTPIGKKGVNLGEPAEKVTRTWRPDPRQFHVAKGPTDERFVRATNGVLYSAMDKSKLSAADSPIKPIQVVGAPEAPIEPGLVMSVNRKHQYFQDANGNLYRRVTFKTLREDGLHIRDLPPVVKPR